MSLRFRLNLALTIVLCIAVFVVMAYLVVNARRAISEELNASVELSSKLVALVLGDVPPSELAELTAELGAQLASVGDTRHLRIAITSEERYAGAQSAFPAPPGVPRWFVRLVNPEPLLLVRAVTIGNGPEQVLLRADAADEIAEAWRDFIPAIAMLLIFGMLANLLIYIMLGPALRALTEISSALLKLREGDYQSQVPAVGVAEIDIIVERFNTMSAALRRSTEESHKLARQSLVIQEAERRRLAQELHDELGQSISAIKALAVSIRGQASRSPAAVVDSASTIVDISSDIYERVRHMMVQLRPLVLDELGLLPALQHMIDEWNQYHEDTFCEFRTTGTIPRMSDDKEINCYRIVQEALTNIAKHAQATTASVCVARAGGDSLSITISDDGSGFERDSAQRGLGLVGIRERTEALGGSYQLEAGCGAGTRWEITIPLGSAD